MVRKAKRRDHRERATALAKSVHAAIDAYNRRFPHSPFTIDDASSRILENDPDYHPPRQRAAGKKRAPTENPGVFTVTSLAEKLDTTVGALLSERGFEITNSDLRSFRWISDFLRMRFPIDTVAAVGLPDEQSFIEKEFSFPRVLTTTKIQHKGQIAAGPTPVESDFEVIEVDIIGSMKTASLVGAQVKGRSMADRVRDGDTIVIDRAQTTPKQHQPVAVYVENEGGVLGYWRAEAGAYYLDKHNLDFESLKLGHPSEWYVLGVITLVQSRMSRQDRPTLRQS
jgi:SOS-response transcriptional repressor LexA